jgi:hypothetical protein
LTGAIEPGNSAGADTFPMVLDYLADPGLFATSDMNQLALLAVGATRK